MFLTARPLFVNEYSFMAFHNLQETENLATALMTGFILS